MTDKTYIDRWVCPRCGSKEVTRRRNATAGKLTKAFCASCGKYATIKAGDSK